MAKQSWLKQAQQAAKELRAAQRKLYRRCADNVNLLDMAAIELLGFCPGQHLLCRSNRHTSSSRDFSSSNISVGQVWEIDVVTFSNERDIEEQEVLSRSPRLAVRVRRGYGTRWLHGTTHTFHNAFVVTDKDEVLL
jgi:hypothetical protein